MCAKFVVVVRAASVDHRVRISGTKKKKPPTEAFIGFENRSNLQIPWGGRIRRGSQPHTPDDPGRVGYSSSILCSVDMILAALVSTCPRLARSGVAADAVPSPFAGLLTELVDNLGACVDNDLFATSDQFWPASPFSGRPYYLLGRFTVLARRYAKLKEALHRAENKVRLRDRRLRHRNATIRANRQTIRELRSHI